MFPNFSIPVHAAEIDPGLQSTLEAARGAEKISVIIEMTDPVDLNLFVDSKNSLKRSDIFAALKARAAEKLPLIRSWLLSIGAKDIRDLWLINGIAAKLPAAAVNALSKLPFVMRVRLDEVITIPEPAPATVSPAEWNLTAVMAPDLWNLGITGAGVVVANMDTGVDLDHPDLSGRWRGGSNSWYDPNGEYPSTPHDSNGHGTGTMGIMVGGDATGSSIGMAPGAQWIAVKIFNDSGVAATSVIHQGFQWLLDPDGDPETDDAPDVVNNSWGYDTLVDLCYLEFQLDIQILKAAGIVVVFSAGNEGPGTGTSISPANNLESFAVGAVSEYGFITNFSSRGPSACMLENDIFPEISAPGYNIKTADLEFIPGLGSYQYASGTSFAAPHVAGGLALLRGAFPDSTPSELEDALKTTTLDAGPEGPDNSYGYGIMDVLDAYRLLVPCTDSDGDGFYLESQCDIEPDCNDGDPDIFPGAVEIQSDGIDQDCNGYDLTINILSALYYSGTGGLEVLATSDLNESADLMLEGVGPMTWNSSSGIWEIITTVSSDPGTVRVSGTEGIQSAFSTNCTDSDGDGFYGDSQCGTDPDCDDNDPESYPGAGEIPGDGIDQDCNGYDLTIEILSAIYRVDTGILEVTATSELNEQAALTLDGVGPMTWNTELGYWEIITFTIPDPETILVSGIEGSRSAFTSTCTDSDSDGFYAEAQCGTAQDCDDSASHIFPGAVEIKHDGIDQDCNGYDLSIEVISAVYNADNDALEVVATSDFGDAALLQLDGFGPMLWNPDLNQWEIVVNDVGGNPDSVTVSGPEGSESLLTTMCMNSCPADFNGDGAVNFLDLGVLKSNFGADCTLNPPGESCIGDANGDLHVNFLDLGLLKATFGSNDCIVCQ